MIILGISGFLHHDPAAALLVDGRLAAAAEEERFARVKHAPGLLPERAARACLEAAGVEGSRVDLVAVSWSLAPFYRSLPGFLASGRHPRLRAWKKAMSFPRRARKVRLRVERMAAALGIDARRAEIVNVEHHLAHAASAFLFSGFEDAAVFTADGQGELVASWAGTGSREGLRRVREWALPDSLGMFYSSVTQYLGFPPDDGEYRTMGMAPHGDPSRADLSDLVRLAADGYAVDGTAVGLDLRQAASGRRLYSDRIVERFGPPRTGDGLGEPYVHVAASAQRLLEEAASRAVSASLGGAIASSGNLCLAGGVAMNVVMNRRLAALPGVRTLYVPPAAGDAGCAPGAAAFAAFMRGERIAKLETSFLGPAFEREAVRRLLEDRRIPFAEPSDPVEECAGLLERGAIVGWFSGRMEFGPRALGNRSILAHPGIPGTADRINEAVKFRERWRPFCPSVLAEHASGILVEPFDSPFMTFAFTVKPEWRERLSQTVHVDGSSRAQVVRRERAPEFHALISAFCKRTGIPAVLNTSLNRRGEPIACAPDDALEVFFGSGLEHLYLQGIRVSKHDPAKLSES